MPQKPAFIGRAPELKVLRKLLLLKTASLVVLSGRRRIGKSRLAEEFAKGLPYYVFSGLAPRPGMSVQDQRNEFARLLQEHFGLPGIKAEHWGDLFTLLAKQVGTGRVVLLFDEISWMAYDDPDFLGSLKTAWDTQFKKNPELILILCGSVSSWIEKNILSSSGYLGRPNLHMRLEELPLPACNEFFGVQGKKLSAYEKLKTLAITGGVPRYLELIDPSQTAEANIHFLCFNPHGPLFDEFKHIFVDIYGKRNLLYLKILQCLAEHPASQETISAETGIAQSGDLSEYLEDLTLGGFIARDYTWNIQTGRPGKLSQYRLKDNYTRFYMKYVAPYQLQISKGRFENRALSTLPNWDTVLGLQFENLVLNNHRAVIERLGLAPEEIIFDNPFFQRKTARLSGCQIDYMIQTRHRTLYVCEIKFKRETLGIEIIGELEEKIHRLSLPKNFSVRPVLIHVNGVTDELKDQSYFSHLLDFGELLA